MDKEFEEQVEYYKNNIDDLYKNIKIVENGLLLLEETTTDTDAVGRDAVLNAIEEERQKLEYLEEIKRVVEVELSKDIPKVSQEDIEMLEKIHNIEKHNENEDETDQTKGDKEIILQNWRTVEFINRNGIDTTYSIRQPLHSYLFLVKLPDIFDTRENEINNICYRLPKKGFLRRKCGFIDVSVRESANTKQLENILKNNGKHIYDEIRLIKVDSNGKYQYTLVFTGLKLERFDDDCYSYDSNETHGLYLHFKYKKIEYVTDRKDETTGKKDNNGKKDNKEE